MNQRLLAAESEYRMEFTLKQAQALVEAFGGDEESIMTVTEVKDGQKSHSGPGLYAHCTDYPEEGSIFLGKAE